jgi:septal ring factor EnvC (AmiA/AmiB activator)
MKPQQYEMQSLLNDLSILHREKAQIAGEAAMFKMKCDQQQEQIEHLEKKLAEKEEKNESKKG